MADDFAQLVKQQADIVRIVGEYVKLRKTGAQNYTGLCPFHKEKTGSFSVNATHGYFYCFGCHEKGDVFTFVMKMDGLSFPEAVRAVARRRAFRCRSGSSPRRKRRGRPGCGGSCSTCMRRRRSTLRRQLKSAGGGAGAGVPDGPRRDGRRRSRRFASAMRRTTSTTCATR